MINIANFLIKQSSLISDDVRLAGIAREESSPYFKNLQARRRAQEESERLGWEKLQNTLRTGQGYQDWMGEYFLDGLGLRNLEQLDDPKVQEYFLRKAEGKDPGNMHAVGLYQPAGFFKKRDSEGRLLNAAVEYIKNKRNIASVKPQETSQPVSIPAPEPTASQISVPASVQTSTPSPTPSPTFTPAPVAAPEPTPAPATVPAVTSPALPSSALTAAGGANVSFQTPTVNIPEFNSAPKTAPAPALSAQATQNPFYDPKSITRQQMRQYRRYTGATNMNSDMDRWKTYQAMNGNRNASNADYYSAKRNNSLGAVKNPITQPK